MTIFNIFIIFLISIIMATLSYGFLKKSIYASSDELLLNKATDAANLVDERIKRYILNIESVAKYQKIKDPDENLDIKLRILKEEMERLDYIDMGIIDLDGNVVFFQMERV